MKKIILSLAMAAFLFSGSAIMATESVLTQQEMNQVIQDGQKKSPTTTATKKTTDASAEKKDATKKEDCGTSKAAKKDDCGGSEVLKKKSCCSDGKTTKEKSDTPEKK
jgi:hypothetical protein